MTQQSNSMGQRLLVSDIGGTHARFALAAVSDRGVVLDAVEVRETSAFASLASAIADYAKDKPMPPQACLAVAGPVAEGKSRVTNVGWELDAERIARESGFARVELMNDFAALAYSVAQAGGIGSETIKSGTPKPDGAISVIGAGTGFGVALLAPCGKNYALVPTEGGHASFAPADAFEARIWAALKKTHEHVSTETLLSGSGLSGLYEILTGFEDEARTNSPEEISHLAAEDENSAAAKTLTLFFGILGSVAGDIALLHGAKGGVYLAGGVVTKNETWLRRSDFLRRFGAKGAMAHYVADIPVSLITDPYAALNGAALWAVRRNTAR